MLYNISPPKEVLLSMEDWARDGMSRRDMRRRRKTKKKEETEEEQEEEDEEEKKEWRLGRGKDAIIMIIYVRMVSQIKREELIS